MSIDWLVVVSAAAMCSCRHASCDDLVQRKDHAAAATVCARSFEQRGDLADGVSAVRAFGELQRDDEARRIASRLFDGPRDGEARRTLARVYLARHQFDQARPLLDEALRRDRGRGDHKGAYLAAAELVAAYWARAEFASALKLTDVACAEAAASGDPRLRARSRIAQGSVFQAVGDSARALDAYARASAELPSTDHDDRARVLLYRGALLHVQRQDALARPLFEEARALAVGLHMQDLVLAAEVNLADIALVRRDLEDAARHLDGAEAAWRAAGETTPSHGLLVNRAILGRYRGDFAVAAQALDAAAAADPSPESAWSIAYERAQLAAARHDLVAAEASYLAAIAIIENMWRTSSPDEFRAPFLEDRWQPYQSLFALRVERNAPAAAFETAISAQGRMFLAEALAASTGGAGPIERLDRLRALAPVVASSPLARTFGAAETLAALGDRYVLDYFSGGDRMRLLVLDHGHVRVASVDIEAARLEQLVDDFLAHPDDRGAAQALGEALLPPDALASAPVRFHVIPDGPLLRVPFAALVAGGARVLERHEVVYAPSATGLAGMGTVAPSRGSTALLLGDARSDLRHAAEETAHVVAATQATVRTGGDATIAALRSAGEVSLLHIVSHSGVGIDGGYLLLADGRVTAADILAWHVGPRLVVLPTCASAATTRSDMWGSLAVAFLAAGSVDVVATLFSVEDRTAAEFSEQFYRHRGAHDPVAATAAAQRELATRYPTSAWSAFIVVGL